MHTQHLPEDQAIVLQQLFEDGSDDFDSLSETLQYDKQRLLHILTSLRHKGLLVMQGVAPYEAWLSLTTRGQRLVHMLWPEATLRYS